MRAALAGGVVLIGALGLAACEANLVLTVNTTDDRSDAAPGDGICEAMPGADDCTLRAAVDEGNASPSRVPQIMVPKLTSDYFVSGSGLQIHPASGFMIIHVSGATIRADFTAFDVQSGTAQIDGAELFGSVHVETGANVTLERTHLLLINGPALVVDAGGGGLTRNVELRGAADRFPDTPPFDFEAPRSTPAVINHGTFNAQLTTVLGPVINDGAFTARGSVLRAIGPAACSSPITSGGYNVFSDATCGPGQPTDVIGNPKLVHDVPDFQGSPALDSIPVGTPGLCDGTARFDVDVRGLARPQGGGCDRGAVEEAPGDLGFLVNSTLDARDSSPGDGICRTAAGKCTLRAAADEVNAGTGNLVSLAVDPFVRIPGAGETDNVSGSIDFHRSVTIQGHDHTVNGARLDRVLTSVAGQVDLILEHVTVTAGQVAVPTAGTGPPQSGAGILGVDVLLYDSRIIDNRFTGDPHNFETDANGGGGVFAGNLIAHRSRFSGNLAFGSGGGIFINNDVDLTDSVISNNAATFEGGGMYCFCYFPDLGDPFTVSNSTIESNNAPSGAGIRVRNKLAVDHVTAVGNSGGSSFSFGQPPLGPSRLRDSIVITQGVSCDGLGVDTGTLDGERNVARDNTCGGSNVVADPLLGPLGFNGGTTLNRVPRAGSPVIDIAACSGSFDQRTKPRPVGANCDAGSVERQPTDP